MLVGGGKNRVLLSLVVQSLPRLGLLDQGAIPSHGLEITDFHLQAVQLKTDPKLWGSALAALYSWQTELFAGRLRKCRAISPRAFNSNRPSTISSCLQGGAGQRKCCFREKSARQANEVIRSDRIEVSRLQTIRLIYSQMMGQVQHWPLLDPYLGFFGSLFGQGTRNRGHEFHFNIRAVLSVQTAGAVPWF